MLFRLLVWDTEGSVEVAVVDRGDIRSSPQGGDTCFFVSDALLFVRSRQHSFLTFGLSSYNLSDATD